MSDDKGWIRALGCRASAAVADIAAHPFAQVGVILFCALWWLVELPTDILTAALSILAITLTQMVLNRQDERELDIHRRDVAMHAKLDELVLATKKARNVLVGIEEELPEDAIQGLKEQIKAGIDAEGDNAGEPREREVAKAAVENVSTELLKKRRSAR